MPEQVIKYLYFIDQCWQKYNSFYNTVTILLLLYYVENDILLAANRLGDTSV